MNRLTIIPRRMASSAPLSSTKAPFVAMPSVIYNGKKYTRMVSPYTMGAVVSHFSFSYEYKSSWMFRYFLFAFAASYPLYCWIHSQVNSPQAKAAWEAKQRADKEKAHKKHAEMH